MWCCLPRFDGDPVFSSLLAGNGDAERGFWDVIVEDLASSQQAYSHNTAVLITTLTDRHGGVVEITDFAPRFSDHGRMYRPLMIMRQVRCLGGQPRIRVRIRPAYDWGLSSPEITWGSNHIRYVMPDLTIRLTTDAPLPYVLDETPFVLDEPVHLILGPDETFSTAIAPAAREAFERTHDYWLDWSRSLSIPFEWQKAVIRAAITLKLCAYESTGAIVAAVTTSIPEAPGSARNWDYRYCWLRDAYFVVHALNRLGATKTMERFLSWITNVVGSSPDGHLQPVYGIGQEANLTETTVEHLPGYRGMGPVRVGNQAYEHIQNDVYGSVILAADPGVLRPAASRTPASTANCSSDSNANRRAGGEAYSISPTPVSGSFRTRALGAHLFRASCVGRRVIGWGVSRGRLGLGGRRSERWSLPRGEHSRGDLSRTAWSEEQEDCFVESFERLG